MKLIKRYKKIEKESFKSTQNSDKSNQIITYII